MGIRRVAGFAWNRLLMRVDNSTGKGTSGMDKFSSKIHRVHMELGGKLLNSLRIKTQFLERLRRKRVGCCRRLESTRINHELASCFNSGCEYKMVISTIVDFNLFQLENGWINYGWFLDKTICFHLSWSLVETSLIFLRWLIRLWLFQLGVRVEFWLNQPRLISGWNNFLSISICKGWFNYGCFNSGCEYNSGWINHGWFLDETICYHLQLIFGWNKPNIYMRWLIQLWLF